MIEKDWIWNQSKVEYSNIKKHSIFCRKLTLEFYKCIPVKIKTAIQHTSSCSYWLYVDSFVSYIVSGTIVLILKKVISTMKKRSGNSFPLSVNI